jgi:PilZ domain
MTGDFHEPSEAGMLEHREHPRDLVLKTAQIRSHGDATAIDCAILNISQTGACVLVPPEMIVPERFDLSIDREDVIYACRLVWRAGSKMGLAFTQELARDPRTLDVRTAT